MLVIGGEDRVGTYFATTEVLDVAGKSTAAGPELGIPRSSCTAVPLPGDRILVIGGSSYDEALECSSEILCMPVEE